MERDLYIIRIDLHVTYITFVDIYNFPPQVQKSLVRGFNGQNKIFIVVRINLYGVQINIIGFH